MNDGLICIYTVVVCGVARLCVSSFYMLFKCIIKYVCMLVYQYM